MSDEDRERIHDALAQVNDSTPLCVVISEVIDAWVDLRHEGARDADAQAQQMRARIRA